MGFLVTLALFFSSHICIELDLNVNNLTELLAEFENFEVQ